MKAWTACTLFVALSLLTLGTAFGQTLTSDKPDYSPGEIATLTGSGFAAGEEVRVQVLHEDIPNTGPGHDPWFVTADADGNFGTAWTVVDDAAGSTLRATADGVTSGAHAEVTFTDTPLGTGELSVTAVGGACLFDDNTPTNSVESWDVQQGGTYTLTLTNVEPGCSGTIPVTVHNSTLGNVTTTATETSTGSHVFVFTFTVQANACLTFPVFYTCGGTAYLARRSDGGDKESHLRASSFGSGCSNPVTITDCQGCTPPTIQCPATASVECGGSKDPSVTGTATATPTSADVAYSDGLVAYSSTTCQTGTFVRTWTVSNGCGTASCEQTINIVDTTPPVISALPRESTIECPATPSFATPTATDVCDGSPRLTYTDVTTPGRCAQQYTVTRTWTATDCSGNRSTASERINVVDRTPPMISRLPDPSTVECPAKPSFAKPTVTDCDPRPNLTSADVTTPGTCAQNYSMTRTWTATDCSGNRSTASQTINVVDTTPPVISALPDPSTIECPATPSFGTPTATDACDPNPGLTSTDVTTPGTCAQSFSVTRTWTATDACGNQSAASQTINVEDKAAPVISSLPDPSTIECPATPSFATPTATDACDPKRSLTSTDVTTPGSCAQNYSVTRTWTAKDACGNTSTASQTINVEDTKAPVFSALPDPSTIDCPNTPNFTTPTTTDCGPNPSVTFVNVTTPGQCGAYSVTRTWTAKDACGNTSTASQRIAVQCPQQVCALKFYDANANGVLDDGETCISGWPITVTGPTSSQSQSGSTNCTTKLCFSGLVAGSYTVSEGSKPNWKATTPTSGSVTITCDHPTDQTFKFGNVCLGAGGGLTMGFWSNKNAKAILCADMSSPQVWRVLLNACNLKNANGTDFDILLTASCATADQALSNWLTSASATNMAYMLSAQLAAMKLNVLSGGVSSSALVFAGTPPAGCTPAATLTLAPGYFTINDLMTDANMLLGSMGGNNTVVPSALRSCEEFLKNALDNANNNLNFVQSKPCNGLGSIASGAGLEPGAGEAGMAAGTDDEALRIFRAAPNPFTNTTRLDYAIGASEVGAIRIAVFDIAGRQVRTLVNGVQSPGRYSLSWDGRGDTGDAMPRGLYFVHGSVGGRTLSTRVLFMP